MRISDWSSDVCSSDLNGSNADVGGSPLCPSPSRPQWMGAGNMQADPVCLLCSLPLAAHAARDACAAFVGQVAEGSGRSEEHTSELQSLMRNSYAVFCLKKKTIRIKTYTTKHKR